MKTGIQRNGDMSQRRLSPGELKLPWVKFYKHPHKNPLSEQGAAKTRVLDHLTNPVAKPAVRGATLCSPPTLLTSAAVFFLFFCFVLFCSPPPIPPSSSFTPELCLDLSRSASAQTHLPSLCRSGAWHRVILESAGFRVLYPNQGLLRIHGLLLAAPCGGTNSCFELAFICSELY